MSAFEGFGSEAERQAVEAEERKQKAVRSQGREAAIMRGRLLGAGEAERRGETGLVREQRVARAMLYAAWEHDGKPAGRGETYASEFGVGSSLPQADWGTVLTVGARCVRESRHHLHHGAKPCPECGYPKVAA